MATEQQRLDMIGSTVLEQARQEAAEIRAGAEKEREAALRGFKDQVIDRMYAKVQAEVSAIKADSARERAACRAQAHRDLLRLRQELTDSVFDAARARLRDYAATPAYREKLLASLRELAPRHGHDGSQVLLRPEDGDLAGQARDVLGGGCCAQTSASVGLGGFLLRDEKAGILIDCTLESRLRDERAWFLSHCGLRAVEAQTLDAPPDAGPGA